MQTIYLLAKSITSMLLIIIGSMIPSALLIPKLGLPTDILILSNSMQVPTILLSSIVLGYGATVISITAYIIIGLFYLPVFHGGGSLGYILVNEFGYILGFIPASIIVNNEIEKTKKKNLEHLILITIKGLLTIHCIGILYIFIKFLISGFSFNIIDEVINYSIIPMPVQLLNCIAVGTIARFIYLFSKSK